jgi:hypothetical protein
METRNRAKLIVRSRFRMEHLERNDCKLRAADC